MKKDAIEIKKRKDILLRSRHSQPSAEQRVSDVHSTKIKTPTEAQKKAAIYRKAMADKAKWQRTARTAVRAKDIARKSAHEARQHFITLRSKKLPLEALVRHIIRDWILPFLPEQRCWHVRLEL